MSSRPALIFDFQIVPKFFQILDTGKYNFELSIALISGRG